MSTLLARSVSESSTDTVASTVIPFLRRRMSPDQVQALHNLYELKSHPSKEERADLARELDLELKVVNVWFQNKRRSMKKKSVAWNRATALMSENAFGMGSCRFSTLAHPSKQQSVIRRHSSISLDSIASSREKREQLLHPHRPPLTPRKNTMANTPAFARPPQHTADTDMDEKSLWDHLLSSPPLPPSSPTKETDLLSNLPPHSKTMKSLEWACAKDRVGRRKKTEKVLKNPMEEEDAEVPELDLDRSMDCDTDVDEDLITPDNSMCVSSSSVTQAEDVEAAIALLDFKIRN